jgi:ATP-binding cassette subfamily C protein CydD
MSGFDEVVAELPEGLDTVIGSGGLGLSVGQRQRLVLAKALLSSAPVLILDEPTAHLDAATQDRVLTALDSLRAQGRTIIVIAHREALIARADHVIEVSAQHIVSADVPKATPSESTAGRKEGSHVDS